MAGRDGECERESEHADVPPQKIEPPEDGGTARRRGGLGHCGNKDGGTSGKLKRGGGPRNSS